MRREVRSYRELPLNLYQIQTKFRDEVRPRFGLMRGREFIMKDAYSFHADARRRASASTGTCTTPTRASSSAAASRSAPVEADTGAIGGSLSHEFQVLAESGEDAIVVCDRCGYAANVEKAEVAAAAAGRGRRGERSSAVATPGKRTIEEVCAFLGVPPAQFVKTLALQTDGRRGRRGAGARRPRARRRRSSRRRSAARRWRSPTRRRSRA